jgi:hypothetical protein
MAEKTLRQFGLWDSPIGPRSLAQGLRLSDVAWDSDGETLVWLEGRSDRGVLVCARPGGAPRDLTTDLLFCGLEWTVVPPAIGTRPCRSPDARVRVCCLPDSLT